MECGSGDTRLVVFVSWWFNSLLTADRPKSQHLAEQCIRRFETRVALLHAVEEMLSVAAALAQRGERGDGVLLVRRATAGRGGAGLLTVAGRELFQLAGELGDDLLGHALADAVEAGEEARVLRLDRVRDLARARRERLEGLARADAFDGGEGFEELFVLGAEEADERGLEPAARGVAGEVKDRVQ